MCVRACVRACCVRANLNICVNIHRYIYTHKTYTHTELCNHRATLTYAKKIKKGFCPLGGADSSLQRRADASTAFGARAPLFSASHARAPAVGFVGGLASQHGTADVAGLSPIPASLNPFWTLDPALSGPGRPDAAMCTVHTQTKTHTHTHTHRWRHKRRKRRDATRFAARSKLN